VNMRVLGISGSRRKGSNTLSLVKEVLEGASSLGAETELVNLGELKISPCRGCEACAKNMRCVIDDDLNDLVDKILSADGLVIGSPTYFYNVSADIKCLIDRLYSIETFHPDDRSCWVALPEAMGAKYLVAVSVAEQKEERYMGFALEAMERSFNDLGFRCVTRVAALHHFKAGSVLEDEEALSDAKEAGLRLARTIELRASIQERMGGRNR
jgi:multimeric flavodoxin WrbA